MQRQYRLVITSHSYTRERPETARLPAIPTTRLPAIIWLLVDWGRAVAYRLPIILARDLWRHCHVSGSLAHVFRIGPLKTACGQLHSCTEGRRRSGEACVHPPYIRQIVRKVRSTDSAILQGASSADHQRNADSTVLSSLRGADARTDRSGIALS